MAITTSANWYSNSIIGTPQTGGDIDKHDLHKIARLAVGFGFQRADGARFRYCQFGSAITAGRLVGSNSGTVVSITAVNKVIAPATAVAIADTVIRAGDVGSVFIEATIASVGVHQYAGGYLTVTKDTGAGYSYRIKDNTATGTPASGNIRIEIWDPLKVALDNTSDIALVPSKYADVNIYSKSDTNVLGVVCTTTSDTYYGWVQTAGYVGVLQDAAIATKKGIAMYASTATNGAVGVRAGASLTDTNADFFPMVGYLVQQGASAELSVINLILD
jgi:hypothetical protein